MKRQIDLLEQTMKKVNKSTPYGLSVVFGIQDNLMYDYFNGKRVIDDYVCFKIAEILGLEASYVVAMIKAESEKSEIKRDYFKTFIGTWKKTTANIALVLVLSLSCLIGSNGDKEAVFS